MESSLREKQDSVRKEMENMSSRLQQARDETAQEVHTQSRKHVYHEDDGDKSVTNLHISQ